MVKKDPVIDAKHRLCISPEEYNPASGVMLKVNQECLHNWDRIDTQLGTLWSCNVCFGTVRYERWK